MFEQEKIYSDSKPFRQTELGNHFLDFVDKTNTTHEKLFITFESKDTEDTVPAWQRHPFAGKRLQDMDIPHIGIKCGLVSG